MATTILGFLVGPWKVADAAVILWTVGIAAAVLVSAVRVVRWLRRPDPDAGLEEGAR